jgi:hypothetical protein
MSAPGNALARLRRRLRDDTGARRFGMRLLLAVGAAFLVIGALANVVMTDQLERRQIETYARTQQADVESFEATGSEAGSARVAVREWARSSTRSAAVRGPSRRC